MTDDPHDPMATAYDLGLRRPEDQPPEDHPSPVYAWIVLGAAAAILLVWLL